MKFQSNRLNMDKKYSSTTLSEVNYIIWSKYGFNVLMGS
jgi:hypothetical protein